MEDISVQQMLSESPEAVLRVARVACLNNMERYFGDGDDDGLSVISYRNEAAAVSLILQRVYTADGEVKARDDCSWHACNTNWHSSGWQGCVNTIDKPS